MARRPKFGHDIHGKDPRDTGNQLWQDIESKLVGNSQKLADLLSSGNKRGDDLINSLLESLSGNLPGNSHLGSGQSVDFGSDKGVPLSWEQFLNSAGLNNLTNEGYSGLVALLDGMINKGGISEERNDMIYQYLLQMLTASDQRGFDWQKLLESRVYNSPTNELARLMGAGISRDAALQIMSGSAGGSGVGSVIGSGASASAPSVSAPSGTMANTTANTVFNGVQMVVSLLNQGVDMYSAVQTAEMLSAQNYMTQDQLKSYQGVNEITNALQTALNSGVLSQKDFESWKNTLDVESWLNDHLESNLVKPLVSSGAIKHAFGSTTGRDMFNKHWQQMRESKSAGEIYSNFVRQQELATRLAEYNTDEAYYDLQYSIGELSKQDVEIQRLWNDVWQGNIQIQIAGKDLEIKGYDANQAKTRNDIFNAVYNDKYVNDMPDTRKLGNGARYVAFSQFDELSRMFTKAFAMSGTKERRDAWERFFLDNADAAKLAAGIKLQMTTNQNTVVDPNLNQFTSSLVSFYQLLKLTGGADVLGFAGDAALTLLR